MRSRHSVVIAALLLATTGTVYAQEHHAGEHEAHNVFGLKGVELNQFESGHTTTGAGAGLFFEHQLIRDWLDAEVTAVAVRIDSEERVYAVDAVGKKPFELARALTVYSGIGPTLTVEEHMAERDTRFGVALVGGAYVWLGEAWGLELEADYTILLNHGTGHELSFGIGPIARF